MVGKSSKAPRRLFGFRQVEKVLLVSVAVVLFTTWKISSVTTAPSSSSSGSGSVSLSTSPTLEKSHIPDTVVEELEQPNDNGNSNQKPTLTLHVGPPKTATTTIQCGLHRWSLQLAQDDNIYYIGKPCPKAGPLPNGETTLNGHKLLMCLIDGNTQCGGYDTFKARLDRHLTLRHDVVYSNEGFANHLVDDDVAWNALKQLFDGYNVRVVIGYRHYFEWIRSLYYQQTLNRKKYKINWPDQNGVGQRHPSFLSYLDYHLTRYETNDLSVDGGHSAHSYGHHLTLSTYKKYARHFDDVHVLDLYTAAAAAERTKTATATSQSGGDNSSKDIITHFVCHLIPHAVETCRRIQGDWMARTIEEGDSSNVANSNATTTIQRRASKSFDAQRIAEAAYDRGHIDVSLSKEAIVKHIEQELTRRNMDTPTHSFLSCPSPSLEQRLIEASIEFQKKIRHLNDAPSNNNGDDLNGDWESVRERHLSLFEKAKKDGRFCEVDTERVLNDSVWTKFLQQIGKASK